MLSTLPLHANGTIERFNVRLVSNGYNQIKGLY